MGEILANILAAMISLTFLSICVLVNIITILAFVSAIQNWGWWR